MIIDIFKRAKLRISLVYLFCILADTLWLFEPYVLGKMIDGIIDHDYTWSLVFVIINIVFLTFGYVRRVWDTKVFSSLYNEVVLQYIRKHIDTDDTSKVVARTEMSKVITSFLEDAIPTYITVLYGTIGSLIAIYLLHPISSMILFGTLIPAFFISKFFYEKSIKVTRVSNSNNEQHVEKIQSKNFKLISNFFNRKRKLQIMDSTVHAKNILVFDTLGLLVTLGTMVFYISSSSCSVGDALSFYGYVNRYIYTFSTISFCISTIVQIKDVTKRII